MIYEKRFQFSFIGFISLQLLYTNWYFIIQSNSHINNTFLLRFLLQDSFPSIVHENKQEPIPGKYIKLTLDSVQTYTNPL